jgi:hypothetical protein
LWVGVKQKPVRLQLPIQFTIQAQTSGRHSANPSLCLLCEEIVIAKLVPNTHRLFSLSTSYLIQIPQKRSAIGYKFYLCIVTGVALKAGK